MIDILFCKNHEESKVLNELIFAKKIHGKESKRIAGGDDRTGFTK